MSSLQPYSLALLLIAEQIGHPTHKLRNWSPKYLPSNCEMGFIDNKPCKTPQPLEDLKCIMNTGVSVISMETKMIEISLGIPYCSQYGSYLAHLKFGRLTLLMRSSISATSGTTMTVTLDSKSILIQ
ncbi:predicted protein [Lichtheimia corymbifera JMRC:FSU:9682]|uniref:Uncharacterized protein n=1 Tax=Lichtheimia corymbifera JMRC:FSU:9682 TaxID=1263082 RepID=A0A068S6I5_9FUNG|nr:predicted protein [Lichtheimia corymbifera JMRC:FSU:9682]